MRIKNAAAIERLKKAGPFIAGLFKKASPREQLLIMGAGALFLVVVLSFLVRIGTEALAEQQQRLEEMQKNTEAAGRLLRSYVKLKARKDEIEREYQQVEMKEGPLAYLETLVRDQAGVASGFTIKDNPPLPFGRAYEQVPFKVRFSINSLEKLVAFLKEVVKGPKPFILSKLDITNNRRANRLDVEVDVSSIRKAGPASEKSAPGPGDEG